MNNKRQKRMTFGQYYEQHPEKFPDIKSIVKEIQKKFRFISEEESEQLKMYAKERSITKPFDVSSDSTLEDFKQQYERDRQFSNVGNTRTFRMVYHKLYSEFLGKLIAEGEGKFFMLDLTQLGLFVDWLSQPEKVVHKQRIELPNFFKNKTNLVLIDEKLKSRSIIDENGKMSSSISPSRIRKLNQGEVCNAIYRFIESKKPSLFKRNVPTSKPDLAFAFSNYYGFKINMEGKPFGDTVTKAAKAEIDTLLGRIKFIENA